MKSVISLHCIWKSLQLTILADSLKIQLFISKNTLFKSELATIA